mgnify:CR=1 FL=1
MCCVHLRGPARRVYVFNNLFSFGKKLPSCLYCKLSVMRCLYYHVIHTKIIGDVLNNFFPGQKVIMVILGNLSSPRCLKYHAIYTKFIKGMFQQNFPPRVKNLSWCLVIAVHMFSCYLHIKMPGEGGILPCYLHRRYRSIFSKKNPYGQSYHGVSTSVIRCALRILPSIYT